MGQLPAQPRRNRSGSPQRRGAGTPVIRYGEETATGENLALRERLSVRTPMQWSEEQNGGFSKAPAQKLVRPVISSGEYRFERVVVAVHNFSRAACTVRIKWPEGTGELLHLLGRTVHAPLAADSQAIDLDGYDYRWMKVRSAGRAA